MWSNNCDAPRHCERNKAIYSGFDIVIGNPPYIDSETMTNVMPEMRKKIADSYKYTKGNWDFYIAFYEKALELSCNVVSFITPDKWLSKPFGELFREKCMIPKLQSIMHAGSKIFKNATVDSIVTVFTKVSKNMDVRIMQSDKSVKSNIVFDKTQIQSPYYIDFLFTPYAKLFTKIDKMINKLLNISECENACATHDCYELKPLIYENEKVNKDEYKLINTGTIGKYISKWGRKECTYLGTKFNYPVVKRVDFEKSENLGKSYRLRAKKSKLILKGLNLLDVCIDFEGEFIPGKSTLIIPNNNVDILKYLSAILNSKFAFFYLKIKYSSSSYCGGTTFTKDMLNNLPIPQATAEQQEQIAFLVDQILALKKADSQADTTKLEAQIDQFVYALYGLTAEEIAIVEGK